jgi:hypothetical protein
MTSRVLQGASGLVVGIAAFSITYYATRPSVRLPLARQAHRDSFRARLDPPPTSTLPSHPSDDSARDSAPIAEKVAWSALRNRILDRTGERMQLRNISVMDCLDGVELVGDQRIRFVVHVVSTPARAIVSPWTFAGVVDGQQLPDAFPACAEAAMGPGMTLDREPARELPAFEGDVSVIYRIDSP